MTVPIIPRQPIPLDLAAEAWVALVSASAAEAADPKAASATDLLMAPAPDPLYPALCLIHRPLCHLRDSVPALADSDSDWGSDLGSDSAMDADFRSRRLQPAFLSADLWASVAWTCQAESFGRFPCC